MRQPKDVDRASVQSIVTPHPGIHQLMSAGTAKHRYEDFYASCGWSVRPSFLFWWYMEETREPGEMRVGHLHPDYLEFEQWLEIRKPPRDVKVSV